jgi:thioredoxin-like negative regulator of GroEL
LWTLGIAWLRRDRPQLQTRTDSEEDHEHEELFREAQRLYLKGHWLEAEALAAQLIARQPVDVEARLLWASILRRSGQWREARKMLMALRDEAAAGRWQLEIEMDLRQIEELVSDREAGEVSQLGQARAA